MAKSKRQRRLPGKRVRQTHPFTWVISLPLALLVLLILITLYYRVQRFQRLQQAERRLLQVHQVLEERLTRDLFNIGLHRGSCWQSPLTIDEGGSSFNMLIVDQRVATVLQTAAPKGSKGLQLSDINGVFPGMLLKLCAESYAELLVVDKTFRPEGADKSSGARLGRLTFTNATSGESALQFAYPVGATVTSVEEVDYKFRAGEMVRRTRTGSQETIPAVHAFQIKTTAGSYPEVAVLYTLIDPPSELQRQFQLAWKPWYSGPAISVELTGTLYQNLPALR